MSERLGCHGLFLVFAVFVLANDLRSSLFGAGRNRYNRCLKIVSLYNSNENSIFTNGTIVVSIVFLTALFKGDTVKFLDSVDI